MNLNELLKQITPLPWGDKIHGTFLPHNGNGCETQRKGNRAYIYHAANQLPKLIEALEYIATTRMVSTTDANTNRMVIHDMMTVARNALAEAKEVKWLSILFGKWITA